jgi:hypothetical protein
MWSEESLSEACGIYRQGFPAYLNIYCFDMLSGSPHVCQMKSISCVVHMKSMKGGQELTGNKGYSGACDTIMCSAAHQCSA